MIRLIASARLIAVLTLGSRLLGLIREIVFSYYFSTSELLSAFRVAFMAPNLARRLFGEGALAAAMIPVLTESLQARGEGDSRRFIGRLLAALTATLVVVLVVVELLIAAWRTVADDRALELTAILMPYMWLICTVAVGAGVLHVRGRFGVPAASPMILNSGIILAAVIGAQWYQLEGSQLIYAVCAGILIAGVIQVAVTGWAMQSASFFPIFSAGWSDERLRSVVKLMSPMILGLSAVQINSLADYVIAYLFVREDGQRVGPAVLGYAQYLYQLPLGVFGIAIATAIFPQLSKKAVEGDEAALVDTLLAGMRLSLFIALPATIGLIVVSHPLVATLYERGQFDAGATQRVAGTLIFYSVGLAGYFTQHLLVRAFYAVQDSRTPARVALWMVGFNVVLNLVLVIVLEERGLALATSLCAILQVVWLGALLRRRLPSIGWGRLLQPVGRMLTATAGMGAMLWSCWLLLDSVQSAADGAMLRLAVLLLTGVAGYAAFTWLLSIDELRIVLQRKEK